MHLVRAKLMEPKRIEAGCQQCLFDLLRESRALGGLPLAGDVVEIPAHRLNVLCPHGEVGFRFELADSDDLSEIDDNKENSDIFDRSNQYDARMDATKDGGFPMREHGPKFGSQSMYDSHSDESDADSPGKY